MRNRKSIPTALVIASCISLPNLLLVACDLSGNDGSGSITQIPDKPDQNGASVGTIIYTQRFLSHGDGSTLVPAKAMESLADILDTGGERLGLEVGDKISFTGSIGGVPAANAAPLVYTEGASAITLQDILDKIRENFDLPERDGTAENNLSVSINPPGSDDGIPDGVIVIRGRPGKAFAINDVAVRASDGNSLRPSPSIFNTNMNTTVFRKAADVQAVVNGR
jgi:hypothetical protein